MHNEIGLARLPDVNWSSKIARQFMSQHINEYVAICNDMYLPYLPGFGGNLARCSLFDIAGIISRPDIYNKCP